MTEGFAKNNTQLTAVKIKIKCHRQGNPSTDKEKALFSRVVTTQETFWVQTMYTSTDNWGNVREPLRYIKEQAAIMRRSLAHTHPHAHTHAHTHTQIARYSPTFSAIHSHPNMLKQPAGLWHSKFLHSTSFVGNWLSLLKLPNDTDDRINKSTKERTTWIHVETI